MYRMLQAVERQPTESLSSYDERTNVQPPAPTNNQQRDIYVRRFNYSLEIVTATRDILGIKYSFMLKRLS